MPVSIATVEAIISKASGVPVEVMRGKNRGRENVLARHLLWLVARDHMGFSFMHLARIFGRDHTTIMNGVQRMRADQMTKTTVENIKRVCPQVFTPINKDEKHPMSYWQL